MKRIITLSVQDESGVLNRITGLLSRRSFNIDSITVGPSEKPNISKMTISIDLQAKEAAEQLIKQLNKQIHVLKVNDITDQPIVERELALIKVRTTATNRAELQSLIAPFRPNILDVSKNTITIEITGKTEKIDAMIELLSPYGIREISRTGITAFPRGNKS